MEKTIKEQKMEELGEELIRLNRVMCHARDNNTRMMAAQRAYTRLGLLLGLADLDYDDPIVAKIRRKQVAMFGKRAVVNIYTFFALEDKHNA